MEPSGDPGEYGKEYSASIKDGGWETISFLRRTLLRVIIYIGILLWM
jgi:hypothetical protein